jgi:DNA-binding response OmpR family regulator
MKPYRVLLVLPPSEERDLICLYLGNWGYTVVVAETALAALAEIEQTLPAVMMVMTELGATTGWQLVRDLRQAQVYIPTLFVLSREETKQRERRIADFVLNPAHIIENEISQPFDIEELRLRLANLIRYRARYFGDPEGDA